MVTFMKVNGCRVQKMEEVYILKQVRAHTIAGSGKMVKEMVMVY